MLPPFTVVIPCFNEEARIAETLRVTLDYLTANAPKSELIVVNDGSTDATAAVAREKLDGATIQTRLLENFPNRGKGAAVRSGLLAAQKPIGLFFDADLSTPLGETPKLIQPIANGEVDIAFGSRALDRSLIGVHQPWRRAQGGRVLEAAHVNGFAFDVELLSLANRAGLRIREIPVRWNHAEGSKVSFFRDSLRMLREVIAMRAHL